MNIPTKHRPMDKVLFRTWPDGTVTAVWPAIPADNEGNLCQTYEHIGQHGGGDWNVIVKRTRAATPSEYQDLLQEITAIGYCPIIIHLVHRKLVEHRRWVAKHHFVEQAT